MQTINAKELITSARPPLPVKPGLEYYRRRAADYALRHVDSRRLPPNYYLDYGDKYARRFTQQLRPKLSASGQAWIDRTFLKLQQQMEQQRHTQPDRFAQLEEDARAFKDFAYGLHAEAYIDCGIGELPTRDLVLIALTPDLGDLLTMTAVQQAARVTLSIIQVRWRNLARSLPPYAWRSPITN